MVDVFGIRFKPEGIYQVFGMLASEIQSDFADMESIIGRNFREYTDRLKEMKTTAEMIVLSEKYLVGNLNRNKINLFYLNRAAEIIRRKKGLISIELLSSEVYISKRQLEREFKKKLGISPNSYMRIVRLNEVNRQIQNGRRLLLTNLAYVCGYSDHGSFYKRFQIFHRRKSGHFCKGTGQVYKKS